MRTFRVNHSEGPFADGREPARLISIFMLLLRAGTGWKDGCLGQVSFDLEARVAEWEQLSAELEAPV